MDSWNNNPTTAPTVQAKPQAPAGARDERCTATDTEGSSWYRSTVLFFFFIYSWNNNPTTANVIPVVYKVQDFHLPCDSRCCTDNRRLCRPQCQPPCIWHSRRPPGTEKKKKKTRRNKITKIGTHVIQWYIWFDWLIDFAFFFSYIRLPPLPPSIQ